MAEEEQEGTFPEARVQENCLVLVNRKEVVSALAGLFLHASDQDQKVELRVAIEEDKGDYVIDCRISTDRGVRSAFEGASYQTLREVKRILSEHDTSLQQDHSDHELLYRISFPKAGSDA